MSGRVSFADLLKAGAAKDKQRLELKPTPPTPLTLAASPILKPIAPEKNFTRVANSIARKAVPEGLFIGKSKQIYDYLYSITRGAMQPTRIIRITKAKLMQNADIGSERTLHKNLTHLKALGLIKIVEFEGQHQGNEYETFLPEEIASNSLDLPHPPHPRYPLSKVEGVPPAESGVGGVGYLIVNKATCKDPKTSFKDIEEIDDEPAARGAVETVIDEVSKKLVGKGLKSADNEKLKELAELLKMELEIAAARTNSISNVPAFLTEHLRRRLSKNSQIQFSSKSPRSQAISKSMTAGKAVDSTQGDGETYQAEPLSEQARETVLKTIREYIEKGQRDFVMSFQDTYTAQDWQWLSDNLADDPVANPTSKTQNTDENLKIQNSNKRL
jgi:hypothetical protein